MLSALKKPGEVAVEVIMLRLIHPGSFFLLEGDTDSLFWRAFKDPSCEIINAGSKTAVAGAIEMLDRRRFQGALGLVDADLDHLQRAPVRSKNLILSDAHDLECQLLRSRALERVLLELADQDRLMALEQEEGRSLREALLARGLLHGKLRWFASRASWGPDFQGRLQLGNFLHPETWILEEERLLDGAATHPGCPVGRDELSLALGALHPEDPWRLCRGHDLVEVLRIGLKSRFGRRGQQFGRDALSRALRLACGREELGRDATTRDIREWERRNPPFLILEPT